MGVEKPNKPSWIFTPYYKCEGFDRQMRNMITDKLSFDDIFTSKQGQHPPILKYFLSKKINFETLIILDDILKFSKRLNKSIKETVIWPKMYEKMMESKKPNDEMILPENVADTYWYLYSQPRSNWTLDLDIRPWKENPWMNSA